MVMPETPGEEIAPPTSEELAERGQAAAYAEGIGFVVRSHRVQATSCYERVFKLEEAPPGGRVELGFTIDAEGRAQDIHVVSDSTGREELGACLSQRVADWRFPRPPAGEFAATYPFTFAAAK